MAEEGSMIALMRMDFTGSGVERVVMQRMLSSLEADDSRGRGCI